MDGNSLTQYVEYWPTVVQCFLEPNLSLWPGRTMVKQSCAALNVSPVCLNAMAEQHGN